MAKERDGACALELAVYSRNPPRRGEKSGGEENENLFISL